MAEPISERMFLRNVLLLFKTYGWKVAHFDASVRIVRNNGVTRHVGDKWSAGYPDITATRGGRLIFAELKSEKGRVSREQQDWLDALAMTGMEVYVWRPSDLPRIVKAISKSG